MFFAFLTALAMASTGCSGINSSQSVSPLDFLLPGAGHFLKADPSSTNAPDSFPEISKEFALTK
jgi:hypothetical protein